jgi:nitrogen regulatory protein P-II 1
MFLLDSPIVPEPSGVTTMKMIVAIIRPERLEAVQTALGAHEIYLMTVSDVRGCGRQRGFTEQYRGNQVLIRLLSKVKLEIAVNDNFVEPAVEAIKTAAHSGKIGDGKIFVLPPEEVYRIRTGETGSVAIGP